MKKHLISNYYLFNYLVGLALCLACAGMGVFLVSYGQPLTSALVVGVPGALGALWIVFKLCTDFMAGTFAADGDGITLWIGGKAYRHEWEEIEACDIVSSARGSGRRQWVYFATRALTEYERAVLVQKTRKDLRLVAYFQYDPQVMAQVLPLLPEDMAAMLRSRGHLLDPSAEWTR